MAQPRITHYSGAMAATDTRTPFPEVGGHPAFDLVDTVHWRLDNSRATDTLISFADVAAWCTQVGALNGTRAELIALAKEVPDVAAREHKAVLALREAIYEAVFESSGKAVELIAREYVAALTRSELRREVDASAWSWRTPHDLTGPRAAVALLAHNLLTSDVSDARQCGDDACGWVYLDKSPRHNRVWCTSAGCGNRNRVARHQARKKT
jgi:predicted RNA-binding Zn ribbon-like protein